MLGVAAGDHRFDAALRGAGGGTCRGRSRGRRSATSGRRRGRPTRPATRGHASSSGSSWVTSLRLPPVSVTASGMPARVDEEVVLGARRGPGRPGSGPSRSPLFRLDVAGVDDRPRPVDLASRPQAASASSACSLSHTPASLPLLQPAPAGQPRPEAELLRQMLPRRSRCAARTGSRTAPPDPAAACGPDSATAAPASAAAARPAPTTRPRPPTADSSHRHPSQLDDRCRRASPSGNGSLHSAMSSKPEIRSKDPTRAWSVELDVRASPGLGLP